ncbi:isocitrate lyase/PEP mutase family protein [Saccharothrix longispora]|uniref:isocitrate lyase/PEP mutase family protein n=1 Tax=Saccharothrix longispora TaxID=33920 RepID=UPI0028FD05C7|nr:isocitrate lyase/PEP mutase family protein [Saccharothrix longispora]MBY8848803.1 isocitrate lyase/PEP mutase family protein [Saccharothrix sp. MB29]MDU0290221.1 isocitrate lyase/PEP mutase family protein [Saccharothrix longispora]
MAHGEALRAAVASEGTTPVVGVFDMLSASVAARHYDALFVSGFGLAASHYGLPDIGFIAWPDVIGFVQRLRLAFPDHHLLVDIDDGYVDVEVACHVVRALEQVGASGVVLEDQSRPRRCGHVGGKQVLPLHDYLAKLTAVLDTRTDLVVVARTDATDEAEMLRRATALAATDADAVLVDGVPSAEVLRRIARAAAPKPVVFNQIAGGRSPALSLAESADLGVGVAIYSTPCLFAAHAAMDEALSRLRAADGRLPGGPIGVAESQALLRDNLGRPRSVPVPRPASRPAPVPQPGGR